MERKLIKAVQKQEPIYKRTSVYFKSKPHRDKAWVLVSRDVGVSEEACRVRWRSLRDRFVRENTKLISESEGGVVDPSKCAWEHYKPMMFLQDEIILKGNYNTFKGKCCTRYSKMDKFLINAVKDEPLLYDGNETSFRNKLSRQQAWCNVSEKVGRSPDFCRKNWKDVRSRYIRNKLEGRCKHIDVMDFMRNHTDNIIDSDDDLYTWPKEESLETPPKKHSYAADTSAQYSYAAESDDEYTNESREPTNKSFAQVFIEGGETNELPTSSNSTNALSQQKVMEAGEKFEKLVGTLNNFVESRIEKVADGKSRNHEYYKVLDRYLQKMSEDEQDKIKAEILTMVFNQLDQ